MQKIQINTKITGVAGNSDTAPLELSMNFYPLIQVSFSSSNPEEISNNIIRLTFEEKDLSHKIKKEYVEEMKYFQLQNKPRYFVDYIRMWPSLDDDRIFKFACMPTTGYSNCAVKGDIYFEIENAPEGLYLLPDDTENSRIEITSSSKGVIKDQYIEECFILTIKLTKEVDRSPKGIKDIPLVFKVINENEEMEVGRLHLSVAPKDVFSKEETKSIISYFETPPKSLNDDCITAVRKGQEKLLNIKLTRAITYKNVYNMYSLMEYMDSKNLVAGSEILLQTTPDGRFSEPEKLNTDIESVLFELVKEEIGLHIFTVSWISAYHTATFFIDNTNPDKMELFLADQFGFVKDTNKNHKFKLENSKNLFLSLIKSWWGWVKKNYSTTNAISKLWKITRVLLILCFLNLSCISKSNSAISQEISVDSISVFQDSSRFCSILNAIQKSNFQYLTESVKEGNNLEEKEKHVIHPKFISQINHYKTVSFDTNADSPMCYITQFTFDKEEQLIDYIVFLEREFDEERNEELVILGHRIFFTKSEKNLFLFETWTPYYYESLYNLKKEIDSIIIKPTNKDIEINSRSPLNMVF